MMKLGLFLGFQVLARASDTAQHDNSVKVAARQGFKNKNEGIDHRQDADGETLPGDEQPVIQRTGGYSTLLRTAGCSAAALATALFFSDELYRIRAAQLGLILVSTYTPYDVADSRYFYDLSARARVGMQDQEPQAVPEMDCSAGSTTCTRELMETLSNSYTAPVVLRNYLTDALEPLKLDDPVTWKELYSNKENDDFLVCFDEDRPFEDRIFECTPAEIFESSEQGGRVKGLATQGLVYHHESLFNLLQTPMADWIDDRTMPWYKKSLNERSLSIFFGLAGHTTDMHAAVTPNLFKQVTGSKKWTLVQPSEFWNLPLSAPYHSNGALVQSVHEWINHTSLILQPIPRLETTLNPGDMLFNPAWWGHIVTTVDPPNWAGKPNQSISVGCTERFIVPSHVVGADPFLTMNMVVSQVPRKLGGWLWARVMAAIGADSEDIGQQWLSAARGANQSESEWSSEKARAMDRLFIKDQHHAVAAPRAQTIDNLEKR